MADREASERFYELVLSPLGVQPASRTQFRVVQASPGQPPTRGLHIGFRAPSRELVDEFWRAGRAAGYRDDGAPGPRPEYSPDYYGAFLLDPDGNSAEAVHGAHSGPAGGIDHLWIRVADVAAASRFYETVAPQTAFHRGTDTPDRVQFAGRGADFSLVADPKPTKHVHLAFRARGAARLLDPDGNTVELVTPDSPGEPSVDLGTA